MANGKGRQLASAKPTEMNLAWSIGGVLVFRILEEIVRPRPSHMLKVAPVRRGQGLLYN